MQKNKTEKAKAKYMIKSRWEFIQNEKKYNME